LALFTFQELKEKSSLFPFFILSISYKKNPSFFFAKVFVVQTFEQKRFNHLILMHE